MPLPIQGEHRYGLDGACAAPQVGVPNLLGGRRTQLLAAV